MDSFRSGWLRGWDAALVGKELSDGKWIWYNYVKYKYAYSYVAVPWIYISHFKKKYAYWRSPWRTCFSHDFFREKSCNYNVSHRCIDLGQPTLQSTPLSFVSLKIGIALTQPTSCGERVEGKVGAGLRHCSAITFLSYIEEVR